jgi:Zn-finger nucleic acid-binding protein
MNAPLQQLTCPKCRGAMTSYERSGVVIDQCTECRGVFLDRGELERLLDLDAGTVRPGEQPQFPTAAPDRSWRGAQPSHQQWPSHSKHDWDDDSDDYRRSSHGSGHKKKRHSLLKDLLDF